jgi:hypothetical protein
LPDAAVTFFSDRVLPSNEVVTIPQPRNASQSACGNSLAFAASPSSSGTSNYTQVPTGRLGVVPSAEGGAGQSAAGQHRHRR